VKLLSDYISVYDRNPPSLQTDRRADGWLALAIPKQKKKFKTDKYSKKLRVWAELNSYTYRIGRRSYCVCFTNICVKNYYYIFVLSDVNLWPLIWSQMCLSIYTWPGSCLYHMWSFKDRPSSSSTPNCRHRADTRRADRRTAMIHEGRIKMWNTYSRKLYTRSSVAYHYQPQHFSDACAMFYAGLHMYMSVNTTIWNNGDFLATYSYFQQFKLLFRLIISY